MRKLIKITFLVLTATFVLLLALGVALLFSPGFQKMVVLRAFRQADGRVVQLGHLRMGMTSGEIREFYLLDGQQGISVDHAAFDYSLFSLLFRQELHIERCELKGLLIDASHPGRLIQVSGNVEVRVGTSQGEDGGEEAKTSDRPVETGEDGGQSVSGPSGTAGGAASPPGKPRAAGLLAASRAIGLKYRLENVDVEGKILLPEGREVAFRGQAEGVAPGATGTLRMNLEFTDKSPEAQLGRLQGTGSLEISQTREPGIEAIKGEWRLEAAGANLRQTVAVAASFATKSSLESDVGQLVLRVGEGKPPAVSLEFHQKHFRREVNGNWKIDLDLADLRWLPKTIMLPPCKIQGQGTITREELSGTAETKGDWKILETTVAGLSAVAEGSLFLRATDGGALQVNFPLKINGPGGVSDLLVSGALRKDGSQTGWKITFKSEQILADDLQAIVRRWFGQSAETPPPVAVEKDDARSVEPDGKEPAPSRSASAARGPTATTEEPIDAEPSPDLVPFWKGLGGTAEFMVKRLTLQGKTIEELRGKLTVDHVLCRWDNLEATLGGQKLQGGGELEFISGTPFPYQLASSASVSSLDVGKLLSQLQPGVTPMLEAQGGLFVELTGSGANLHHLTQTMRGFLHLKTGAGVFHPLAAGGANVEKGAAIAGLAGALLGKQLGGGVAALPSLLESLREIPFRSFEMKAVRQRNLDFTLETFDLRSPDLRFNGVGGISYRPGTPIVDQPLGVGLTFAFPGDSQLAVKFNEARLLDGRKDADGFYLGPTFQLFGTLRRPSTNLVTVLREALARGLTAQPLTLEKPQP